MQCLPNFIMRYQRSRRGLASKGVPFHFISCFRCWFRSHCVLFSIKFYFGILFPLVIACYTIIIDLESWWNLHCLVGKKHGNFEIQISHYEITGSSNPINLTWLFMTDTILHVIVIQFEWKGCINFIILLVELGLWLMKSLWRIRSTSWMRDVSVRQSEYNLNLGRGAFSEVICDSDMKLSD